MVILQEMASRVAAVTSATASKTIASNVVHSTEARGAPRSETRTSPVEEEFDNYEDETFEQEGSPKAGSANGHLPVQTVEEDIHAPAAQATVLKIVNIDAMSDAQQFTALLAHYEAESATLFNVLALSEFCRVKINEYNLFLDNAFKDLPGNFMTLRQELQKMAVEFIKLTVEQRQILKKMITLKAEKDTLTNGHFLDLEQNTAVKFSTSMQEGLALCLKLKEIEAKLAKLTAEKDAAIQRAKIGLDLMHLDSMNTFIQYQQIIETFQATLSRIEADLAENMKLQSKQEELKLQAEQQPANGIVVATVDLSKASIVEEEIEGEDPTVDKPKKPQEKLKNSQKGAKPNKDAEQKIKKEKFSSTSPKRPSPAPLNRPQKNADANPAKGKGIPGAGHAITPARNLDRQRKMAGGGKEKTTTPIAGRGNNVGKPKDKPKEKPKKAR